MASAPAEELKALVILIDRMNVSEVLSQDEAERLSSTARIDFLQSPTSADFARVLALQPRAPIARKGSDPAWGVLAHSLGYHVQIAAAQFDDWQRVGHVPPPYSMRRIPMILKRLTHPELAAAFTAARDRHFGWLFT